MSFAPQNWEAKAWLSRGVWPARNLALVRGNDPALVLAPSSAALKEVPDPAKPIALLASLHGVGPATASAVASAFSPETYPFFDELVKLYAESGEAGLVGMPVDWWTGIGAVRTGGVAAAHLEPFGEAADLLRQAAKFVVARRA